MQDIESDLEEDIYPSTYVCLVTIPTNLPSTVSMTDSTSNPFETMIPQHTFSEINLSHIISVINDTPSKFIHMTIVTHFSNLPIFLAPFEFLATSTSSQTYSLVSQPHSYSIPTTSS